MPDHGMTGMEIKLNDIFYTMRVLSFLIAIGLMMCMSVKASAQGMVTRKPSKPEPKPLIAKPKPTNTWIATSPVGGETDRLPSLEEMAALGAEAYQRNAYAEALQWCGLAAKQGSGDAQLILGDIYLYGKGTEEDHTEAAKWYRKAAGQDVARAQFILATLLYLGDGVPQDYSEAHSWAVKGAEKGDAGAQFLLGEMYADGNGVPASVEEAAKWYGLSAAQGNVAAQAALDELRRE